MNSEEAFKKAKDFSLYPVIFNAAEWSASLILDKVARRED
jgi:hypothetical protein